MHTHSSPESTRIHQSSSSRGSQQDTFRNAPVKPHLTLEIPGLTRHGTLLTSNATPARAAAELKSILGNHNSRLKSEAALIRLDSGSATFNRHVTLEQAKARARVEVDILPQTNICVQGGYLRGHVKILIRKTAHRDGPIFISGGKIRVIGFESLRNKSRSIFYQCSAMLASVTPSLDGLYASERDTEGFALAKEGEHELPFGLYLSVSNDDGQAKGFLRHYSDIALNYIAMVSLKIKDDSGCRSVAHFYRYIEVWPRLDPTTILSPALRPLQATASTNIPESDIGRIKLTASLHRLHWIAGQSCQVKIDVNNGTARLLKRLTLSLHRTITIFRYSSSGDLEFGLDTHQPQVSTKQVVESVLEAGQVGSRGHASAKGWWLGVPPQRHSELEHSLLIPLDALTVLRGRIFEIEYSLHIAVDSGTRLSSNIQAVLPIRIVGFHSIDPPPSQPTSTRTMTPLSTCLLPSRQSSKVNTSNLPRRLSKSRSASFLRKEIQDRNSTTKTDEDKIFLHGLRDILYQKDTRQSSLDYDDELGNLSSADDSDDIVQPAVTTVRMNPTYGRFSDLYYLQDKTNQIEVDNASLDDRYEHSVDDLDSESATGVLETLMAEVALHSDSNEDTYSIQMTRAHQKLAEHRYSSFATRVEEKMHIATAALLNGDRDTSVHLEQLEDSPKCNTGHRNRKPHLTLKTSPILGGETDPSSEDLSYPPHHQLNGFDNNSNTPTGHSDALDAARTGPNRNASIDSLSSQTSICSPLALPFQRRQPESMNMASAPTCSHGAMRMSDKAASRDITLIKSTGRQDTLDRLSSDANLNDDTIWPRVDHSTVCIGAVKAATASAQTLTSPASATSTSAASIGGVSVKDKVRQLEERVKASTSP